jgi:hypothetical protein
MGNNYVKQEHGYMFIQLSKLVYQPGEQVNGTIYLRTTVVLEVNQMVLQIKGEEKGSFWVRVHRDKESHDEKRWYS